MERLPHSDCTGHNVIVHDAVLWRGAAYARYNVTARRVTMEPTLHGDTDSAEILGDRIHFRIKLSG